MKKVVATSELKEISKTVFYISLIVFTLYDLFLVILLESNLTQNTWNTSLSSTQELKWKVMT